ncbi:hypothetical protein FRAHR75_30058 [Frankia sp. Hr75.2]|nr:hypothetical protein FRAHR75_30058 [Frankia sp. Hr75.2]SQD99933.1 hypothetical protein FMEAI12_5930001 [Parafrankia sp. Ea1.12]
MAAPALARGGAGRGAPRPAPARERAAPDQSGEPVALRRAHGRAPARRRRLQDRLRDVCLWDVPELAGVPGGPRLVAPGGRPRLMAGLG